MRTHRGIGGLEGRISTAARSQINVTPLVDVCLVLLIIFMVMVPQLRREPCIALPETARPSSLPAPSDQITLAIDANGSVVVEHHAVPAERLLATLRALHGRVSGASLVVAGDRRLRYRQVTAVLAVARQAGFERAGLETRRRLPS